MTQQEQFERIVAVLEHVQKRPYMYISVQSHPVLNFIHTFNLVCHLLEAVQGNKFQEKYNQIIVERGWERSSGHPVSQMEAQNMDFDEIITEALNLEIETWKRLLAELPDNE